MSGTRMRLFAVICLLQAGLTGCGNAEKDRLNALAGTYAREKTVDAAGTRTHERMMLTLRTDRRWTMLREGSVNGKLLVSSTDSGTFSFKDMTLVTNSPRDGIFSYTVSGDTLWMNAAEHVAVTQAVTGMNLSTGGAAGGGTAGRGYLLRQR